MIYIYDIETYPNLFLVVFFNIASKKYISFKISDNVDESTELIDFVKNKTKGLIGFNNIEFDYVVLEYLLINKTTDPYILYTVAQMIIENKYKRVNKIPLVPQLDLYKIHNYQNAARSQSLKGIEVFLRMHKVEDLPYKYNKILTEEEKIKVEDYCKHDVHATYEFFNYSKEHIELRQNLSKLYNIDLTNESEPSIGLKILQYELYGNNKSDYYYALENKDIDENFTLNDIISDKIKFQSPELKKVLNTIKNLTPENFQEISFLFRDCVYTLAKGGLHSKNPPKIYESSLTHEIIDLDFNSYYPGLMLSLDIFPPQIGERFLHTLRDLMNRRLDAKRNKDKLIAGVLKIVINSIYGKLGEEFSFTYSPKSMYKTTINGQLFLLMLIEQLTLLNGISCFYANTDGATFMVDRTKRNEFDQIISDFEKYIDITSELTFYKKCVIVDVNNYIIEKTDGELKPKGLFVWDKEPHKDPSFEIIPIALKEYFINNIPTEQTIITHDNIFDFCGRIKLNKAFVVYGNKLDLENRKITSELFPKTIRCYISNSGYSLTKYKLKNDGSFNKKEFTSIYKGAVVKPFNTFISYNNFNDYNINYSWYIKETNKIIMGITEQNLTMHDEWN